MKAALLCLAALAAVLGNLLQPRSACIADNCARAVTGTVAGKTPDVASRQADCSSFMTTTVTPATSTTTMTITVVGPQGPLKRDLIAAGAMAGGPIAARQQTVIHSDVPTYAAWCSGTSRYSSACSCWGITATVTTAPTPIVTETATATATCEPGGCGNTPSQWCEWNKCYCGARLQDGTGVCVGEGLCTIHASCGPSGSCAEGYVCITDTCCGRDLCQPVAVGVTCLNAR